MSVFSEKASVDSVVKNILHSNNLSFDFTPPVINNRLIFKPFKIQTFKNQKSAINNDRGPFLYIDVLFSFSLPKSTGN